MKKSTIIGLAIGGVVLFSGAILVLSGISVYNDQATIKNTYEMKIKSNEAEFDNLWKTINQTAQIPEAQKNAFKEIYTSYASSRTSEGQGKLMSWVQEAVPNYNGQIYSQLMNIITGSRDGWTMRQNELVDLARVYNANLVTFPKNVFLKTCGFEKIDPKIITSTRTEETFKTGKDDETQLFTK